MFDSLLSVEVNYVIKRQFGRELSGELPVEGQENEKNNYNDKHKESTKVALAEDPVKIRAFLSQLIHAIVGHHHSGHRAHHGNLSANKFTEKDMRNANEKDIRQKKEISKEPSTTSSTKTAAPTENASTTSENYTSAVSIASNTANEVIPFISTLPLRHTFTPCIHVKVDKIETVAHPALYTTDEYDMDVGERLCAPQHLSLNIRNNVLGDSVNVVADFARNRWQTVRSYKEPIEFISFPDDFEFFVLDESVVQELNAQMRKVSYKTVNDDIDYFDAVASQKDRLHTTMHEIRSTSNEISTFGGKIWEKDNVSSVLEPFALPEGSDWPLVGTKVGKEMHFFNDEAGVVEVVVPEDQNKQDSKNEEEYLLIQFSLPKNMKATVSNISHLRMRVPTKLLRRRFIPARSTAIVTGAVLRNSSADSDLTPEKSDEIHNIQTRKVLFYHVRFCDERTDTNKEYYGGRSNLNVNDDPFDYFSYDGTASEHRIFPQCNFRDLLLPASNVVRDRYKTESHLDISLEAYEKYGSGQFTKQEKDSIVQRQDNGWDAVHNEMMIKRRDNNGVFPLKEVKSISDKGVFGSQR